jgi:hypothetical protein
VPCETDPDRWWPDRRDVDSDETEAAVAACSTCSAVGPCRDYAVAAGERDGVWGALRPEERKAPGV